MVVVLAWLGMTAVGRAQENEPANVADARERVARGTALIEQEDYDAALAEFEAAYELLGDRPTRYLILFNIARAHELRFRYDLALRYYQRYLEEGGPDAQRRAEVEATLRTLEGLLATLEIASNVPAEVWAGERMVGEAPGTVIVPAGRHTLELRAQGYMPGRREIQIAARQTQSLRFELSELGAGFRGIDASVFWTSFAVAIAAGLAGGSLSTAAYVRDRQLRELSPAEMLDATAREADLAEIRTYALASDILYGVAGLFALGALVFAFFTDWGGAAAEQSEQASVRIAPWMAPNAAGGSLAGTF